MKSRIAKATTVILLVLAVLAAAPAPAFAEKARVQETVLPNGLEVITKEVHAAPVVTFNVWYKVGSRNEHLGSTGMSHLLEHMQFKGTKTFGKGEIDKLIRKVGGINNAATWKDFTWYFETVSSEHLELAMRIEADRMVNSLFDPKEHKAEMTVVRSELEGDENSPETLMYYELYATAFKAHPYQWPTIGWRADVESITRDEMYEYYQRYYRPNNATVVIVGDFDTEEALALVKKYFGSIPKGPELPQITAVEPEQLGERRSEIRKAGAAYRVMMGCHTPAIGHPDIYALDVLEIVLDSGRSSRLYKALVDKQLATQAWAGAAISQDPNLFTMGATARDGVNIEDVENALLDEIERLKTEPISDQELQKALNQLEAHFVYTNDSVTAQARQLGYYETVYSWRFLDEYLENARKVTKADVQRAAKKYLTKKNRTVVTFIPQEANAGEEEAATQLDTRPILPHDRLAAYRPDEGEQSAVSGQRSATGSPPSAVSTAVAEETKTLDRVQAIKPTRVVLDNGMVVIIHENRSNPTVGVRGSLNAGSMLDPEGKSGLAGITAGLLVRGTAKRTADQIAEEKDFVGMTMDTSAGVESATFSGYALSKHFDLLLSLLSDVLRNPTFPGEEFEKLKARRLSTIKQELDNPRSLASRTFNGSVFPAGHPYHRLSVEQDIAAVENIARQDVLDFYKTHYGPESAVLVVVGDVDTQEAIEKMKSYFGNWEPAGRSTTRTIPDAPLQSAVEKKVINMPDKSQVDIILGYAGGLKRSDPDFYAAQVMNFILGGGGALSSRLGDVIRDEMGLVYNVYSVFSATLGAGAWYAYLGTNPQNADKAIGVLVDEITRMRDKGATKEEMEDAVDYITGSFPVRLEKNSAIANMLHAAEFYELGMDYIQRYQELYRAVTLDQVNAAAKKYLHPDRYTLVVAGPYEISHK